MTSAEIFDALASMATAGGLFAAIWQLWVGNRDRRKSENSVRAERAMHMYEEVVAGGPVADAFHDLSVFLHEVGSAEFEVPTWHVAKDIDFSNGGIFSTETKAQGEAFRDLFTVLWFFERVASARASQVIDSDACYRSMGYHIWWWDQILYEMHAPKARKQLRELATWVTELAKSDGQLLDWQARCMTDFDGGPYRQDRSTVEQSVEMKSESK